MQWVPENERTTAWYLFNERFECRVPYLESRSPEHIRMFGTPYTGIPEYDEQTANELVRRLLTIAEMAEYVYQGVTVYVNKVADTEKIYSRIQEHLMAWRDYLKTAYNTKAAPIEDLVKLDKLAQVVYPLAKPFMTGEMETLFSRQYRALGRGRSGIIKRKSKTVIAAEEPVEEQPRASMADVFIELRRQRG